MYFATYIRCYCYFTIKMYFKFHPIHDVTVFPYTPLNMLNKQVRPSVTRAIHSLDVDKWLQDSKTVHALPKDQTIRNA